MFERERKLLTFQIQNVNFQRYTSAVNAYIKQKRDTAAIQELAKKYDQMIVPLYDKGMDLSNRFSASNASYIRINYSTVKELVNLSKDWMTSKKSFDVSTRSNVNIVKPYCTQSRKWGKLDEFEKQFITKISDFPAFEQAIWFLDKLKKFGSITETNFKDAKNFIDEYNRLSTDVKRFISKNGSIYQDFQISYERFNELSQKRLFYRKELEALHKNADVEMSIRIPKESEVLNYPLSFFDEHIQKINTILRNYLSLKKEASTLISIDFENKAQVLNQMIKEFSCLKSCWNKQKLDLKNKQEKKLKIINISNVICKAFLISISLFIIIMSYVSYYNLNQSAGGDLDNIIVIILFVIIGLILGIVRIMAMLALGGFWCTDFFAGMIIPPILLNVLFFIPIGVYFTNKVLTKKLTSFNKLDICILGNLPTCGIIGVYLFIVIKAIFESSSSIGIFEIIWGNIKGTFSFIMLVFAAGFHWNALFESSTEFFSIQPVILNVVFYILLAIQITVDIYFKKQNIENNNLFFKMINLFKK